MNLSHRIRQRLIDRETDALIKRANRPHTQSSHLVGYYVPPAYKYRLSPLYVALTLVLFALIAVFNLYQK